MTIEFTTKSSGSEEYFSSGAKRDSQSSKTRWDLIPLAPLKRLADLYQRGAERYGEHNYQRGIPFKRTWASLLRHAFAWASGDTTEDHLAAVAWNAFCLMHHEEAIKEGKLPKSLDDLHDKPLTTRVKTLYEVIKDLHEQLEASKSFVAKDVLQTRLDYVYEDLYKALRDEYETT